MSHRAIAQTKRIATIKSTILTYDKWIGPIASAKVTEYQTLQFKILPYDRQIRLLTSYILEVLDFSQILLD